MICRKESEENTPGKIVSVSYSLGSLTALCHDAKESVTDHNHMKVICGRRPLPLLLSRGPVAGSTLPLEQCLCNGKLAFSGREPCCAQHIAHPTFTTLEQAMQRHLSYKGIQVS